MDKEQTSEDLSGETWRIISKYELNNLVPFSTFDFLIFDEMEGSSLESDWKWQRF